jgi:hypothetical protein
VVCCQGALWWDPFGVREEVLEVEDQENGDHFVSMIVRNRKTNFRWELTIVYGHVQHDMVSL